MQHSVMNNADSLKNQLSENNRMEIEEIKKIYINEKGCICIQPQKKSFDMIYRGAMGIQWDDNKKCLTHEKTQKWSLVQWYKQILRATKNEYGIILKITPHTEYEMMDEETVQKIIIGNDS